jgi:hypothetical protein
MLVKHYGQKAAFHPHVPARTFDILLRSVSVPSNIDELLLTGVDVSIVEAVTDEHEEVAKRIFKPK